MTKPRIARDATRDAPSDLHLQLIERFPLRPIRSDDELDRAINIIGSPIDQDAASPRRGSRGDAGPVAVETGISESTVSEVLAGKRRSIRRHIEALSGHFHVSPAVFLPEPGC